MDAAVGPSSPISCWTDARRRRLVWSPTDTGPYPPEGPASVEVGSLGIVTLRQADPSDDISSSEAMSCLLPTGRPRYARYLPRRNRPHTGSARAAARPEEVSSQQWGRPRREPGSPPFG